MPVLILLEPVNFLLKQILEDFKDKFSIEVHNGPFQNTKQELSNLDTNKLYILLNCNLKPHRYEIFCLAKKQETSYVVINTQKLSTAKHDNPCVVANSQNFDSTQLLEYFSSTLKCSTAHKKKIVGGSYLSKVKEIINRINSQYPPFINDCESRLMKMISLNPVSLEEVEKCYSSMVEEASNKVMHK
ncbi:hypothetical protein NGRA_1678 [Nosema granulosis]|uniref:Uncharacterized protein n=1 Tax=Nosema granulosis TaxID=83296 RepID=A0A9P6KYE2_9MICR|nr:hypothetical protein NGRA_1678 [Nosema granulosis]